MLEIVEKFRYDFFYMVCDNVWGIGGGMEWGGVVI